MRVLLFLVLVLVLVVASGCGLNEFDLTQSGTTTVPGSTLLGGVLGNLPAAQGLTNFDVSQSQEFKNQNTEKKYVRKARLTSFSLRITAPADQDFAFLDSLQFFAEANGTKTRVAHAEGIARQGLKAPNPTLVLTLDDVDLTPVVKADTMSITTAVTGRQPSKDTALEAKVVMHLTVGP